MHYLYVQYMHDTTYNNGGSGKKEKGIYSVGNPEGKRS
jgi:hypothetical protein